MIRLPRFNFQAELSVKLLRAILDQLNTFAIKLEQVLGYDARIIGADFTLLAGFQHRALLVDTSAVNVNVTLPLAVSSEDMRVELKHYMNGNTLTILPTGADTIDGGASLVSTTLNESFTLVVIKGAWYVI